VTLPVAIILAAGVGRRLAPLTTDRPKALLELDGGNLLERSIGALARAGFAEAVVVTGHRTDLVEQFVGSRSWALQVACRFNPAFAATNNIVSFLAAADLLSAGFCLLNSDIVFDGAILADLAAEQDGSWLVVDADEPLGDEEMKVELDVDGAIQRISKQLPPEDCAGEYIGIARFDAPGAASVVDAARRLVGEGRTDLYYEDAIDAVAPRVKPRPLATRGRPWTEIDDLDDYRRAMGIAARLEAPERA
jgi:choline kinase